MCFKTLLYQSAAADFWLGVEKVNGGWQFSDGREVTTTFWCPYEPDTSPPSCGIARYWFQEGDPWYCHFNIADTSCGKSRAALCQIFMNF